MQEDGKTAEFRFYEELNDLLPMERRKQSFIYGFWGEPAVKDAIEAIGVPHTGRRRPPDREPVLRQTWLDVIATVEAEMLFIGGKSMGGRIASLIADEPKVAGLICLGYPFHSTPPASRINSALSTCRRLRRRPSSCKASGTHSAAPRRSAATRCPARSECVGCRTATTASNRGLRRGGREMTTDARRSKSW